MRYDYSILGAALRILSEQCEINKEIKSSFMSAAYFIFTIIKIQLHYFSKA